jgi:hypothetical protein
LATVETVARAVPVVQAWRPIAQLETEEQAAPAVMEALAVQLVRQVTAVMEGSVAPEDRLAQEE